MEFPAGFLVSRVPQNGISERISRFASAAKWNFRTDFPLRECREMEFPGGNPISHVLQSPLNGQSMDFQPPSRWIFNPFTWAVPPSV